ncbi:MAG: transcriptional regulator, partial [Synechococcaceae bacterium WB4_1_0192]|nr:transcriptional regulator [Synechococcaceae bacterium WB4_1_0192]
FGRQKGQVERYRGNEFTVEFLPKMRITTVVADEKVEATISPVIGSVKPRPAAPATPSTSTISWVA